MTTVWIVYHDSSADNNILGVFDNNDEATEYQELVAPVLPGASWPTQRPPACPETHGS